MDQTKTYEFRGLVKVKGLTKGDVEAVLAKALEDVKVENDKVDLLIEGTDILEVNLDAKS